LTSLSESRGKALIEVPALPYRIEEASRSLVTPVHQAAWVKSMGLGLSAIPAGPFPSPALPWQIRQFAA
jgi:hypothetical protein